MACDKAALLQRRHVPKQRCAAHLTFIRQTLRARIALARFFVVEVRQLDQHNLGGWFQAFDIRSPDQRDPAHDLTPQTTCTGFKAFETFPLSSRFVRECFET